MVNTVMRLCTTINRMQKRIVLLLSIAMLLTLLMTHFNYHQEHQLPILPICLDKPTSANEVPCRSVLVNQEKPKFLPSLLQNKIGFEVGGPSPSTWSPLGVYNVIKSLDVTNFASNTLWESGLVDGSDFIWEKKVLGKHYIRDAVDLHNISNETYDFVLASDTLEHIANPLKALFEWRRILRVHGILLLILPLKEKTFDHNRPVNSFDHLINDFKNETSESDLSHLNEILRLHDLSMDPAAGNSQAFKTRSENNFKNRGLHQHVYDQRLLHDIFIFLQMRIIDQTTWEYHQLIVGEKIF